MPLRPSVRRARRGFRPLRLEPLEPLVLPGFLAPLHFDAGTNPLSVAVADFNGDGIKDLAVANQRSATVSVLLGNGDGTFQDAVNYAAGLYPASVAVGDFNGDGVPDLAVAGAGVSVLLGNGDGTFQTRTIYASGVNAVSIAVGDFNSDGIPDFAVVGFDEDRRGYGLMFAGIGDGTFYDFRIADVQDSPSSMVVGDFNGDGICDLAVVDGVGGGQVFLSNGDFTFQTRLVYNSEAQNSTSLTVGDFNGDGIPDLAVAGISSDGRYGIVSVLLGVGDGYFQPADNATVGEFPQSVAVGDFNGDGIPDLAVTNYNFGHDTPSVSVFLGNGDGSFQPAMTYDAGGFPWSLAVGDFDGDGSDDLAVANSGSNNVSILLNDNAWTGPRPGGQPPGHGHPAATAVEPRAASAPGLPAAPEVLPRDAGMADLGAPRAVTVPGETATQRLAPAETVPWPWATTPADRVFADPAGVGDTASGWGWLPTSDLDGPAWTRSESYFAAELEAAVKP